MPTARKCDMILKDGKVYAIGGFDGSELNNFEAYDIRSAIWQKLADLPFALRGSCVLRNDKIFVFGEGRYPDRVCCYDFETSEWSTINSNFKKTIQNTAVTCLDKIFVFGLATDIEKPSSLYVQYFDPSLNCENEIAADTYKIEAENQIKTVTYLNPGRYGLAATVIENDIYLLGGSSADDRLYGGPLPIIEKYSIEENKFTKLSNNILPRRYHTAESYAGKIYILGGVSVKKVGKKMAWRETDIFEVYTVETKKINKLKKLPTPRKMVASVLFEGKIYVIGGIKIKTYEQVQEASATQKNEENFSPENIRTFEYPLKTVEIYDIKKNKWFKGTKMPTARACDIVLHDNKIYAIGGYDGSKSLKTFEVYDIFADRWQKLPDLPFPVSDHHCEVLNDKIYVFGDYHDLGRVCQYDFVTEEWSIIKSNFKGCRHSAVVKRKGKIFILGGTVDNRDSYLSIEHERGLNISTTAIDVASRGSYLSRVQVFEPGKYK